MNGKKLERPLHLDMSADEALFRFVQTRPEEVEPAPGRAPKRSRRGAETVPSDRKNEKSPDPKIAP